MAHYDFMARDEQDTDRLGRVLAQVLPANTTVSLIGTLGAGKTYLVKAIARGRGAQAEDVTSPTFVMLQTYPGPVHHLDAYRVADEDEFLELGVNELFDSGDLTIVEWGDRVSDCLPDDRIEIEITVLDDTRRQFTIRHRGTAYAEVVAELQRRLQS